MTTVLTGGKTKYWDIVKTDWYIPSYGKVFHVNGTHQDFLYNKQDQKCLYGGASDVVIPNTWSVLNDSVLIIGNGKFLVRNVSHNFIVLSLIDNLKLNMVLVKSALQSDSIVVCR